MTLRVQLLRAGIVGVLVSVFLLCVPLHVLAAYLPSPHAMHDHAGSMPEGSTGLFDHFHTMTGVVATTLVLLLIFALTSFVVERALLITAHGTNLRIRARTDTAPPRCGPDRSIIHSTSPPLCVR